jgi:hypothetical protein
VALCKTSGIDREESLRFFGSITGTSNRLDGCSRDLPWR